MPSWWPDANWFTGLCLLVAAISGVATAGRLGTTRAAVFWLLAAWGMGYLAFDEWFSFHEAQGLWLHEQGYSLPAVHNLDSVILGAFALVGLLALAWNWRDLRDHPRVLRLLVAGTAMTAVAFALDSFAPWQAVYFWFEEKSEFAAAILFMAAFIQRLRETRVSATGLAEDPVPAYLAAAALPPSIDR